MRRLLTDTSALVHPCNLKEFKLLVGMTKEHMTEVLHATLKNDEKSETFKVPHVTEHGVPFPTRFVKIVTISYVLTVPVSLLSDIAIGHIKTISTFRFGMSHYLAYRTSKWYTML